jgi:hypothetical protein
VPASLSVTISICSHVLVSSVCCHAPSSAHPSSACTNSSASCLSACIPPDHLLVCLPLCQLVASSRQTTFLPPVCCCSPYLFSACHSACLPLILPLDVCLSSFFFCWSICLSPIPISCLTVAVLSAYACLPMPACCLAALLPLSHGTCLLVCHSVSCL